MRAQRQYAMCAGAVMLLASTVMALSQSGKTAARDVPTTAELEALRAKAKPVVTGNGLSEAPAKQEEPRDEAAELMAQSLFINDGKNSAMVPAGAVIHVGSRRASAVTPVSTDKPLVPWPQFLATNGYWIKELPLTSDQVMGKVKLDPQRLVSLGSTDLVVVTTFTRQPVAAVSEIKETFKKATEVKK